MESMKKHLSRRVRETTAKSKEMLLEEVGSEEVLRKSDEVNQNILTWKGPIRISEVQLLAPHRTPHSSNPIS